MENSWWDKNKQYVYYFVWAIVGLFGGNVDRISEYLPNVVDNGALEKRVSDLEANQCHCQDNVSFERKYDK